MLRDLGNTPSFYELSRRAFRAKYGGLMVDGKLPLGEFEAVVNEQIRSVIGTIPDHAVLFNEPKTYRGKTIKQLVAEAERFGGMQLILQSTREIDGPITLTPARVILPQQPPILARDNLLRSAESLVGEYLKGDSL